jgi:hypothetical protein
MSASNSWAEFADLFRSTRQAFLDHERSKSDLKALMPEDAKEATGHGVRAKRSKSGAISFGQMAIRSVAQYPSVTGCSRINTRNLRGFCCGLVSMSIGLLQRREL